MKTIKVILGIIITLSVIFLMTGLIVKETNYTTKIEINKPVEEVFAKFEDKTLLKEWTPELKSINVIEEKPGKIGSTYKMIVKNQGQEITMTKKVLAYIPKERVTFYFDAESMLKTVEYTFTSKENKTTIVKKSICKSESFLMSCVFPYFKGKLKAIDQDYLNRFKAVVEKE